MSKAEISIKGRLDKLPKFKEDGTVELILKISMSENVPKGLKSLGQSYYIVQVSPKSWKKVSACYNQESIFHIKGETKAAATIKGVPVIRVVGFDISIIEPNSSSKKVAAIDTIGSLKSINTKEYIHKEDNSNRSPKQRESIKWFSPNEIILLKTSDIVLSDPSHLNAKNISLSGILKVIYRSGSFDMAMAVRPVENGKYTLVMGLRAYCIAKLLNIEKVKVVIRDCSHDKLAIQLGIPNYES